MKQFQKNVFRLAGQNRASFLGAAFIIAIGIFIYVSMTETLSNLQTQIEAYYQESALADVFAQVRGISEAELSRLKEIEGIAEVSGKMAADVRLVTEGQEELVTVHLLSYEDDTELNRLRIAHRFQRENDLFLGSRMAQSYGYQTGRSLKLLYGGKSEEAAYAGECAAPDYIYAIPPGGAMVPDGMVYDIACVEKAFMQELLGVQDRLNELAFRLSPGCTFEDVRQPLQEALEKNGLLSLTERKKQASYTMVENEMLQLASMGSAVPLLFLAVSVFMLYIVLRKLIDRDQALIGTMKAFGMSDWELMSAYLAEGGAVGAAGALLGCLLAAPFGRYMFALYTLFFNLPDTVWKNHLGVHLSGILFAAVTGVLAAFLGVRGILNILPAQAMRPPAPKTYHMSGLTERLTAGLSPLAKLCVRTMARSPVRGLIIMLAVAFPFSMMAVLFSYPGIVDQMMFDQFERIQTYDLRVSLDGYTSPQKLLDAAEGIPGIQKKEAVCVLSAQLSYGSHTEFAPLYALNPASSLWVVMDNARHVYEPPERGLLINSRIAKKLRLHVGDVLACKVPGMTVDAVQLPVTAIIDEAFGGGAYLAMDGLSDVFPTEAAANTLLLQTAPGQKQAVKERLMETSRTAWLSDTGKILGSYRDLIGSMMMMINLFALIAAAAGAVLIYHISLISIREREAEFGTMEILGVSGREMAGMLLLEQGVYFAGGIALGIPGCYGIKRMMESLVETESYTIAVQIPASAYAAAFLACLAMSTAAFLAENRFVKQIKLTDILKERE